jgi:hypothetical protein
MGLWRNERKTSENTVAWHFKSNPSISKYERD